MSVQTPERQAAQFGGTSVDISKIEDLLIDVKEKVDESGKELQNMKESVDRLSDKVDKFSEFKIKSEADAVWTKKLLIGFGSMFVCSLLAGFGTGRTEVFKSLIAFFAGP